MTVSLTALSLPVDRPGGSSTDVSFSPSAQALAVASASSPYLWLYRRDGESLERVSVAEPPASQLISVEWSRDGAYLAVGRLYVAGQNSLWLYARDGLTIAKVGEASYQSRVTAIAWSDDSDYLATANASTNLVRVYKRTGDSLAIVQTLSDLVGYTPNDVSFSPDGQYLAISMEYEPYLNLYRRDGDVFTKLANPPVTHASASYAVDWSYDSAYLAVAHRATATALSHWVTVYAHSGDVFAKFAEDPGYFGVWELGGLKWSDGAHVLAVSSRSDDYIYILSLSGTALTVEASAHPFSPDCYRYLDWSQNENFLAVSAASGGFLWYRIDGVDLPTPPPSGYLYSEELLDALEVTGEIPLAIYGAMFEVDDGASIYGTLYQRTTSIPGAYARYLCTLSDLVLPISSLSSRMAAGEQSYLSVVVPDADRHRAEILARARGWLKVYRIAYDASGTVLSTTLIASTKQDSARFHAGSSSGSAQLSGRAVAVADEHLIVPLEGVSSVASHDGVLVVRATPSAALRPGHIALVPRVDGGEDQIEIESISFGANTQGESFEITGRLI